jgi:FKBP-type peptidyl-prolyl cis-trans isomerase (trigger factor)
MKNVEINKKEKSIIEIVGKIESDEFLKFEDKALNVLGKDYEIDGFRKGAVPKEILTKKIPEMYILEEMAQMAIEDFYKKVLVEEKIDAIGSPIVKITKIAKGNPLEFTLEIATVPEFKLPDYKNLISEIEKAKEDVVSEEEVEEAILEVRKMYGHNEAHGDKPHSHGEGDEDYEIPELSDEFVSKLGDFKTIDEFRNKIRENIKLEKDGKEKSKVRALILDKILENTKIEIPEILVEYELDRFVNEMKHDIERMGLSYEDYLKHLTKTEEEMRLGYREDTLKKIKSEFILAQISKEENIKPDEEKIEKEVDGLINVYKDVDKNQIRAYVINTLQNEAVIEFLESKLK